jgi:hypothetical protein
MAHLRPVPATRHSSPVLHKDLHTCTRVFLRQDATRKALEPPYSGPYRVLSRQDKTLKLLVRSRPITVSTDRVKPAYIFKEVDFRNTDCNPAVPAKPPMPPPAPRTTRSGRHVHFPARLRT